MIFGAGDPVCYRIQYPNNLIIWINATVIEHHKNDLVDIVTVGGVAMQAAASLLTKVHTVVQVVSEAAPANLAGIERYGGMLIKKIGHCARCGSDHVNVMAYRLTQPVLEARPSEEPLFTHWAACPLNGEPILVLQKLELSEP